MIRLCAKHTKCNTVLGNKLLIMPVNMCVQVYAAEYRVSEPFSEFTVWWPGGSDVTALATRHKARTFDVAVIMLSRPQRWSWALPHGQAVTEPELTSTAGLPLVCHENHKAANFVACTMVVKEDIDLARGGGALETFRNIKKMVYAT
jgi:hypothetical protein